VKIRRADVVDAEAVAEVWLRSRLASIPRIPPPVHSDSDVRKYFARVVLPEQEVWVAEVGGAVVALLALDNDWIEQLYVHPEHCSKGIGSQLIAVAKRERPDRLRLWTFQTNAGARRLYARHGFISTGSTAGENEEGVPDVRYEWRPLTAPK
jgi:GNAT superfamily N-acetyltransferase